MKRIVIICEGPAEREFCNKILADHFSKKNIHIQAPVIKKSMGGIVKWSILKKEIETYLKEKDVFVTSLIDYYGIYSKHLFPGWDESLKIADKNTRMDFLEQSMKNDVKEAIQHRYIPYLQLHEFEGLLFNEIDIFHQQVPKKELIGLKELKQTFSEYADNPEMINNDKETAPSSRLRRIIKGYNKVLYAHHFAEAIGLDRIRGKSPRFNEWLNKIEQI